MTKRTDLTAPQPSAPHPGDTHPHTAGWFPTANFAICPECNGNAGPGHVCPPKAIPALTPRAAEALGRLEVWAAYLLRNRQTADATRRDLAGAA